MDYHQNDNHEQHPEHPVRNVFFCIFCFFCSMSFNYLWVWEQFEFEDAWIALLIAVLILISALFGTIVSFKKSHSGYFAHRRSRKNNYYR